MGSVREMDPFSPETLEGRYAFYDAMRAEAPVYEAAPNVFFVGGYDAVNQVLRDTRSFSSRNGAAFLNFQGNQGLAAPIKPPAEIQAILDQGVPHRDTLLSCDPPAHTRFRSLVNRSLSPSRMAKWEPTIRSIVNETIDVFIGRGEVELVSEFTMQVPLLVVSLVLGVPPEDRSKYKDWATRMVKNLAGRISYEDALDSAYAIRDLHLYIRDRVEAARNEAQDNVIGDLVNAHLLADVAGDTTVYRPLDTPEIVSIVRQLLIAGQDTVNFLTGSLVKLLVEDPDQAENIRQNPELIPAMVEEGIRIESPIQALGRFCVHTTEVGGIVIPEGARVVVLYGAANRDKCRFAQPGYFDVERKNLREHVGFGAGPHYCVGSALARLESRIIFEQLFTRLKNFRFAKGKNDFSHRYEPLAKLRLHAEFFILRGNK